MLTNLLDSIFINRLEQLELIPTPFLASDNYDAYTYCSDGSCSGDCVGGCDGSSRGNYGTACADGSCSGDCVGGCDGTPAGGF